MCCEQGLISSGLGNNTMVTLFPGMCEIKKQNWQGSVPQLDAYANQNMVQ
jgi:hypothetical protein